MGALEWKGDEFLGKLKERLGAALDRASEMLVGEAMQRAPVDTGTLRRSITWYRADDLDRHIGTPVEYGLYQEVGYLAGGKTFVQNPYLLPALMDNQDQIVEIIKNVVDDVS